MLCQEDQILSLWYIVTGGKSPATTEFLIGLFPSKTKTKKKIKEGRKEKTINKTIKKGLFNIYVHFFVFYLIDLN